MSKIKSFSKNDTVLKIKMTFFLSLSFSMYILAGCTPVPTQSQPTPQPAASMAGSGSNEFPSDAVMHRASSGTPAASPSGLQTATGSPASSVPNLGADNGLLVDKKNSLPQTTLNLPDTQQQPGPNAFVSVPEEKADKSPQELPLAELNGLPQKSPVVNTQPQANSSRTSVGQDSVPVPQNPTRSTQAVTGSVDADEVISQPNAPAVNTTDSKAVAVPVHGDTPQIPTPVSHVQTPTLILTPPQEPPPVPKPVLPDSGSLLKLASSPEIYLVAGSSLRYITGEVAGASNGYQIDRYQIVSPEILTAFSSGTPIYIPSGTLVQLIGSPHIYLISGMSQSYIESVKAAQDNGITLSPLYPIRPEELARYSIGASIKEKEVSYSPWVQVTSSMNSSAPVVVRGKGTFTQSGSGFPPNTLTYLYFQKPDGSQYDPKPVTTDASGNFSNPWSPQSTTPTGIYTFWAICSYKGIEYRSNQKTYRVD